MKNTGIAKRSEVAPRVSVSAEESQAFDAIVPLPIGLSRVVCGSSVKALNEVLADSITLRDLYKKHHWQVSGPTFFQLHQLYDKHYAEQNVLVDLLAERIQMLGGVSVAMAPDIAELTDIERVPKGREPVSTQISRLLKGHEKLLKLCHEAASKSDENGDHGTNDLLVSNVIRTNELQVWFLSQHLVPTELIDGGSSMPESGSPRGSSRGNGTTEH